MSEKIKRIINNLIAVSESTMNEEESLCFANKARELMEKYSISLGDCILDDNPLGSTVGVLPRNEEHLYVFATRCAEYFGCVVVFSDNSTTYHIYGRESARVTTQIMVDFWLKKCRKIASEGAVSRNMTRKESLLLTINALSLRIRSLCIREPARSTHPNLPTPIREALDILPQHQTKNFVVVSDEFARNAVNNISLDRQLK